jgi:hypothetical protein
MSRTPTTSAAAARPGNSRPARAAPTRVVRAALRGLALFAALAALALVVALVTGLTAVFDVVVWLLFTVLWIAFMAAVAFDPATLEDVWRAARRPAILVQAVIWLLFLPVMAGLWIWQRPWPPPVRLTLLVAIAATNVFLFLPAD